MNILNYKLNAIMAKSRAMYGQRLTPDDYNNLMNCRSVNEVASYLRTRTCYSDAFEGTAVSDYESGYLEFLLKRRSYERFSVLCRYEMAFGEEIYRYFTVSDEIRAILSAIRMILLGSSDRYAYGSPSVYGKRFSFDSLRLINVKTINELIQALESTAYSGIIKSCNVPKSTYLDYESALMNYFFEFEYSLIKRALKGKDRLEMMELLSIKADTQFIDKVYRAKKYFNKNSRTMIRRIVPLHLTKLTKKQINLLINCEDENAVLDIIENSPYKTYAGIIRNSDYLEKAIAEENYRRFKHTLRFSTSPDSVMFSFMFLEDIENDNLTHIIEGVRNRTDKETVKSLIIGIDENAYEKGEE